MKWDWTTIWRPCGADLSFPGGAGGISEWPCWGLGGVGRVLETFQKGGLWRTLQGWLWNDTCQVAWTSRFKCLHYLTVLRRSRWRTALKPIYTLHLWVILHKAGLAWNIFGTTRWHCDHEMDSMRWEMFATWALIALKLHLRKPGFCLLRTFGKGEGNRKRPQNSGWMTMATNRKSCPETRLWDGVCPSRTPKAWRCLARWKRPGQSWQSFAPR